MEGLALQAERAENHSILVVVLTGAHHLDAAGGGGLGCDVICPSQAHSPQWQTVDHDDRYPTC